MDGFGGCLAVILGMALIVGLIVSVAYACGVAR